MGHLTDINPLRFVVILFIVGGVFTAVMGFSGSGWVPRGVDAISLAMAGMFSLWLVGDIADDNRS